MLIAWVVGGVALWLLVASAAAVVIGRGIRLADVRESRLRVPRADLAPVHALPTATPAVRRRRRVPLPPVGVGLAGIAVGLEAGGYLTRLSGDVGPLARLLSMDVPQSVPRLFVTGLFLAAAAGAAAGAVRQEGRRLWWAAVGLVTLGVAVVKGGGTWHAAALTRLTAAVGQVCAFTLSVVVAAVVLAALLVSSGGERRDRTRVLGSLGAYAFSAVALSTVSGAVPPAWTATATFLEESGEALSGVAVLVAVLVGVAPRLVLPADWVLQRQADAAEALGTAGARSAGRA